MSLTKLVVVAAVAADSDPAPNVAVTTKDCETTSLALLARKADAEDGDPVYSLPIRKNGTTRFSLPDGHYLFVIGFENVDAPASVSITVKTSQEPSTIPEDLPAPGALTAEKGSMSFDVFV